MSVFLARFPLEHRIGHLMFGAVIVFGFATMTFALSTSMILSLGALVVLGSADVISIVIRTTLVQLSTPDEMRGRVSAVNSLFVGHVEPARGIRVRCNGSASGDCSGRSCRRPGHDCGGHPLDALVSRPAQGRQLRRPEIMMEIDARYRMQAVPDTEVSWH